MNSSVSKLAEGTTAAIVFSTSYGHTKTIAAFIQDYLKKKHNVAGDVFDLSKQDVKMAKIEDYDSLFLCSNCLKGEHSARIKSFTEDHKSVLTSKPSVFVSVGLSWTRGKLYERAKETMTEEQKQANEKNCRKTEEKTRQYMENTNLGKCRLVPVMGAVPFKQYWFPTRWLMKYICSLSGLSTDTSQDHDYTDYELLQQDIDSLF
eukprot:GCRY01001266.1.p1 GENE.GCRY01001266.1~~GCRY01001266.1.p1  ORF type:complete len:205 (+),score=34.79 GCRY01001266.1:85-699(+)